MVTNQDTKRAEKIESERLKYGWSQEHLAEITELSVRTIQRVEKNGVASLETLQALASAFDLKVEDISFGTDKNQKSNNPKIHFLTRLKSGSEIISNMGKREMHQRSYDELKNEEEAELVGNFFDNIVDLGDIWDDLRETDKIRYTFDLNNQIEMLEDHGFWLFGIRRMVSFPIATVSGQTKDLPMEVGCFFLKRKDCADIKREKPEEEILPVIFS